MKRNYHSLESSPFFRLRTKKKLAKLLFTSVSSFPSICAGEERYNSFTKPKSSGFGVRPIDAPRPHLKKTQKRIADLLQRIQPPGYLFSPVKGRSYVDNARQHKGAVTRHLLDIEDFYPSCTNNKLMWFFNRCMECSPDVSAILCDIVCYRNSLPQGSPCSPILAYLAYMDMWDEINLLCVSSDCKLSVYADDITLSGENVPSAVVWDIKQVIHRHGHSHSQKKEQSKHRKPAEITGVIVGERGLLPPNRSHKKLINAKRDLREATLTQDMEHLEAKIKGCESQQHQILNVK